MKSRAQVIALLVAAVAGCATAHVPAGGNLKATSGSAFESQTLYSCSPGTGTQLVFAKTKAITNVMVRSGTLWVKPMALGDLIGARGVAPTSPIPSANAIADGWLRLGDGQTATFGLEQGSHDDFNPSRDELPTTYPLSSSYDQLAALDVWCEAQGDLVVVAH